MSHAGTSSSGGIYSGLGDVERSQTYIEAAKIARAGLARDTRRDELVYREEQEDEVAYDCLVPWMLW